MKLVTLAFIAASTFAAVAQTNAHRNEPADLDHNPGLVTSQAGCPVTFMNVSLNNPGHMMLVRGADQNGSIGFQYKNLSGKQLESIEVRVELTVKRSVYDLDAITITRDMTLTGDSEATLPLPAFAYSVGRVTLEQVNYVGGTVWTPKEKTCSFTQPSTTERIAK